MASSSSAPVEVAGSEPKPKKLSEYTQYIKTTIPQIKAANPGMKPLDMMKEAARMWREMREAQGLTVRSKPASTGKKAKAKVVVSEEYKIPPGFALVPTATLPSSGEEVKKKTRVPRKSAYNIFMSEEIKKVKVENPTMTHKEAFSRAAKNWGVLHPKAPKVAAAAPVEVAPILEEVPAPAASIPIPVISVPPPVMAPPNIPSITPLKSLPRRVPAPVSNA